MDKKIREHKYRYWTVTGSGMYQLHFTVMTELEEDKIILRLAKSETDKNMYYYTSEFPDMTYNVFRADSDEDAMEKMESEIAGRLKELYLHYKKLMNKFIT